MNVDAHLAELTDRLLARLDTPAGSGGADEHAQVVTSIVGQYLGALETLAALGHLEQEELGTRLRRFTDLLADHGIATRGQRVRTSTSATAVASGEASDARAAPGPSRFLGLVEVGDRVVDDDREVVLLVGVELWSDAVLVRWAHQRTDDDDLDVLLDPERSVAERRDAAARRSAALRRRPPLDDWSLQDDLGTTYVVAGGGATGRGNGPTRGETRFRPAVPANARHLVIAWREGRSDRVRVPVDLARG